MTNQPARPNPDALASALLGESLAGGSGVPGGTALAQAYFQQGVPMVLTNQYRDLRVSDNILAFQNWARTSGLISSGQKVVPGVLDDPTKDAFNAVASVAQQRTGGDIEDAMSFIKSASPGSGGAARQPFTAPAFQPVNEDVLRASLVDGLQKAYGKATPSQINKVMDAYRKAERDHYNQTVGAAKAEYSGAPSAGTVEQLPSPSDYAFAGAEESQDAQTWHAAELGLGLMQALRTGGL